jgi:hypothetical protein
LPFALQNSLAAVLDDLDATRMRDFDDLVDFSGVACGVNYDGGGLPWRRSRYLQAPSLPGRIILPRHRMLSPGVARVIAKQAGWFD